MDFNIHEEIDKFLEKNGRMRLLPMFRCGYSDGIIVESYLISGNFSFRAKPEDMPIINTEYDLEIVVPIDYPKHLPIVTEIGGKIPRKPEYHVNGDETLCLGVLLNLSIMIDETNENKFEFFIKNILTPYLYAVTRKIRNGGPMCFGEAEHGNKGVYDYCAELTELSSRPKILAALEILTIGNFLTDFLPCPCGCKKQLHECDYYKTINKLRKLASPNAYKEAYITLGV